MYQKKLDASTKFSTRAFARAEGYPRICAGLKLVRLRTTRRTKGSAHIAHALELTENGEKNGIDFLI